MNPTSTKANISDFIVILNHDYWSSPSESVAINSTESIVMVSDLTINRVERKSEFSTIFDQSPQVLSKDVFIGKSKGGSVRVVIDMAAYITIRMGNGLSIADLRRSFLNHSPQLWLNVRRASGGDKSYEIDNFEMEIVAKSTIGHTRLDALYGYPVAPTHRLSKQTVAA